MCLLYGPTYTLILTEYDFSYSSSLKKTLFYTVKYGNGGNNVCVLQGLYYELNFKCIYVLGHFL